MLDAGLARCMTALEDAKPGVNILMDINAIPLMEILGTIVPHSLHATRRTSSLASHILTMAFFSGGCTIATFVTAQ